MKKAVVIGVLTTILAGTVFAQSSNDFTVRTKSFNGTLGVVIMGYKGGPKEVIIPASFNGIPVMEIGDQAFMLNNIRGVVIPRTVVRIGRQAFYGNKLDAINIPESVREIGDNAFDTNLNFGPRSSQARVIPAKPQTAPAPQAAAPAARPAPVPPPMVAQAPQPRPAPAATPSYQPPAAHKGSGTAAGKSVTYTKETWRVERDAPSAARQPVIAAAPAQQQTPPPQQNTSAQQTPQRKTPAGTYATTVVMPNETRDFNPPSAVVFLDGNDGTADDQQGMPVQNAMIPQRYAKAPPPVAAPVRNYSAVIPDQTDEKYPIVEVVPVTSVTVDSGNYSISTGEGGVAVITAYGGSERNLVLPTAIGSYRPSVVGKLAFWNKYLMSVKIPETIIRIEDSAFSSNSLTEIAIPVTVRYIGYQAFNGNPLQRITIGAAVPMQTDSFPGLFSDYYRINGMIAGTYFYSNGKWFLDR